jgi:hypothetical protein
MSREKRPSGMTGQEYVFLLQVHNTPNIGWIALYPCGALSFSDANLAWRPRRPTEQTEGSITVEINDCTH